LDLWSFGLGLAVGSGVNQDLFVIVVNVSRFLLWFFYIGFLVVKMMTGKRFVGFRIVILREAPSKGVAPYRDYLRYAEYEKVVWFLTWRYLFIGFLVNVLVVVVTGFFSSATTALSWLLCLPLYPVVIRMMLNKQFSTFRFEVVPVTSLNLPRFQT